MLLLSCSQLARGFKAEPLFDDLGFEVRAGERIGLVGPNGAGKTTLLRLLAGLDVPDKGDVRLHAGARVALLEQHPTFAPGHTLFQEARTALDELIAAHDDMVRTAEELARTTEEARHRALAARYDRLNEMLRHHDAYHIDHKVEEVLDGLGFRREDYQREVNTFSGGQQSRLMLAKLLLSAPDVMLLDEPSNHLDIDGTRWLEEYLVQQPEAMIIVSHDRWFLDRVVNKIFELNGGRVTSYPGNYKTYWKLRQERMEQQRRTYEAQQDYIAKQEDYIRRVHYGQLHKQAQSRRKALDRLELVERPPDIDVPQMHFGEVRRSGDIVLRAEGLSKSYDRPLFQDLSFVVKRGQRLGILGPNGSGKTTLLKILMGELEADQGKVERGHLVDFGYYDQHLESLPEDETVLRAVWPDEPGTKEQEIRDLLGRFGLVNEQPFQKVRELSGGQRSRAALAKLVALGVNVLILDEPTNHLDLWACESLEQALRAYEGTVIVVSHDRYFLNNVVDVLVALHGDGTALVVYGNYDTYERMRLLKEEAAPPPAKKEVEKPRIAPPSPVKQKPKRRFPYRKVEELEADIAAEEERLRALEQLLASGEIYRDGDRVKEVTRQFEESKVKLQQLYEHWEEAVELN